MSKKTPELPQIPDLTPAQLHRLLAADYLETMANLVRKGAVTGFDFAWDERFEKPVGKVVMASTQFIAPLEAKLLQQMAEQEERERQVIPVEDLSEQLKDHKCDNEECRVCNNPNKA